ncbi:nuclear apoptosis-inducing factor 1-like [Alosa sapidissima]|uniref:nuclear apoptosis-inducing factor 1-like n=1 Tax=Alosa sapidissima TaxID=34773 RepID=UPI001C097360|nr:nuclear apoptosis-inducing factor 1-like [Alosa sapidissima]
MAGPADKKRRAFNFSQDELEALVQAVEDRKHLLFGKFSMTVTSQSKDRHWKEVADSVSAVCGMLRTVESTKKKWSSLASDAKIRGVLQRRDQAKTGAGLPEVKPLTSQEEKILAVMGQFTPKALQPARRWDWMSCVSREVARCVSRHRLTLNREGSY